MSVDLQSLQNELTDKLNRAERYRRIIRLVKTPIFVVLVLWLLFVFCLPFSLPYLVSKGMMTATDITNSQTTFMTCFVATAIVIMVLSFLFSLAQKSFARIEHETIDRIVRELFPTAKMHATPRPVPGNLLKNSMLFSRLESYNDIPAMVFASFEMPSGRHTLNVTDLGIVHDRAGARALLGIYTEVIRQIFKSRAEMASYLFRGMFAWAELEKRIPGCIVILPDHLEDKLGYMAKHLQSMKNRGDMHLTQMEDPEFERYFAVYTSDEVLARYILTPALMRNITDLRTTFGRDIMLSFNANRFCIAVAMPDGFMNLRGKSLTKNSIIEEIYRDIESTQSILSQINLDKIA